MLKAKIMPDNHIFIFWNISQCCSNSRLLLMYLRLLKINLNLVLNISLTCYLAEVKEDAIKATMCLFSSIEMADLINFELSSFFFKLFHSAFAYFHWFFSSFCSFIALLCSAFSSILKCICFASIFSAWVPWSFSSHLQFILPNLIPYRLAFNYFVRDQLFFFRLLLIFNVFQVISFWVHHFLLLFSSF